MQACRTVFVDRGSAADFLEAHFAVNLAPHLVVAVAGDAAVAASMVHRRKPTAVSLFPLRPVRLLRRPVGVAGLPGLGLCRVQPVRVKHLRAVRMAAVSQRDEFARRADLLQLAKATHVLRLRPALLSLLAVAERRVCLLHAQPVIGLTREPEWHQAVRDRPCLPVDQAHPLDRAPRLPLDLFPDPVVGCPLRARQHELAAEHSLDFRL